MNPQEKPDKVEDLSKLPDLRDDWTRIAATDVWGPEVTSTERFDSKTFVVHPGGKLVAGDGAFVGMDMDLAFDPKRPEKFSFGRAEVEARFGSKVLAHDARVAARTGSYVQAGEYSDVIAFEGCTVRAQKGSTVDARNGSRVVAEPGARVTACGGSRVVAMDGSHVIADAGCELELKKGSSAYLFRQAGKADSDQVKLKAEAGSTVFIADGRAVIDPSTAADLVFSGSKSDWASFRPRNPDLKIKVPDYSSFADIVTGDTDEIKAARASAKAGKTADSKLSELKEPPPPGFDK